MNTAFEYSENRLEIIDQIERCRYFIEAVDPITPEVIQQSRIQYPVGAAVEVTAGSLSLSTKEIVYIRDVDGSLITEVQPSEQVSLPRGAYTLDISVSVKLYICIESAVQIHSNTGQTHVEFGDGTEVVIGARSYHTRPAGTVTSPPNPIGMMHAISSFGSALKSLGPERSYPTLRGHPPTIELDKESNIPGEFERPDTGVQIEIPPTLDYVFPVAPLAYYLGADVLPGSEPCLGTQNGFSYPLGDKRRFEDTVEQILNHVFLLDCIVRTEGQSPIPLYERQSIEPALELDISTVYDQSLAEQLETYLTDVSFSVTAQYWRKRAHKAYLNPVVDSAEFLPFIINYLIPIRTQDQQSSRLTQDRTSTDSEFKPANAGIDKVEHSDVNKSPRDSPQPGIPTIQQSWNTNETTEILGTTPLSAFQNGLDREPKKEPIEIVVVCNDQSMREELVTVYSTYGNRSELPFDVTVHHDLTTDELENALKRESDFLHYIGHIDADGFRCSNGKLNVSSIESIGTKVFFLNACQSHEQGLALIEGGSIGGIVTLTDIQNTDAVIAGGTIARLLNRGYPLYAAVDVVRLNSASEDQYHIVGDGLTPIAQSSHVPTICSVTKDVDGLYLEITYYAFGNWWNGGLVTPYLESVNAYYLFPNNIGPFSVTKPQLVRFLEEETVPVFIDGTMKWSDEIRLREIEAM